MRLARGRQFLSIIPALLFCLGSLAVMDAPGLYMDAVSPDYFVVPLLHPHAVGVDKWIVPGNMLLNRFPVLIQIYHGALAFYLGLPLYALFGTGVTGVRLVHMIFGLMVLLGVQSFLEAFRVRRPITLACLTLLALDPGFIYSFQLQYYTTMLPLALMLAAISLIERSSRPRSQVTFLAAGMLCGLSFFGYFIYFFLLPAAALHACLRAPEKSRLRLSACWLSGCALGSSLYLLGYALMAADLGGFSELWRYLNSTLGVLNVGADNSTITAVAWSSRFWYFLRSAILDSGPSFMLFQDATPSIAPTVKMAALLGLPAAALLAGTLLFLRRGRRDSSLAGLGVATALVGGVGLMVLALGNRIDLHHAEPLLPILYAALGFSLEWLCVMVLPEGAFLTKAVPVVLLLPLLATNMLDRLAVAQQLEATGGRGLASDALTHFAEDSLAHASNTHMFFPDWGVFMSFAMITHGAIPYTIAFEPALARKVLCAHQDAAVAVLANQPRLRLDDWIRDVGWTAPAERVYPQRDGTPVLIEVRWRAGDRPEGACPP